MKLTSRLFAVGVLALALLGAGCAKNYETPNAPVPEAFRAQRLDGVTLDRAALRGKPWVINLWMVG